MFLKIHFSKSLSHSSAQNSRFKNDSFFGFCWRYRKGIVPSSKYSFSILPQHRVHPPHPHTRSHLEPGTQKPEPRTRSPEPETRKTKNSKKLIIKNQKYMIFEISVAFDNMMSRTKSGSGATALSVPFSDRLWKSIAGVLLYSSEHLYPIFGRSQYSVPEKYSLSSIELWEFVLNL